MRRTLFGDFYVETVEDDLAPAFASAGVDPEDCYALVSDQVVEIMDNETGEVVATSDDDLFKTTKDATDWAKSWVSDVQVM